MQQVLLHTLPGRAIVVGLAARIAIYIVGLALGSLPGFLAVVDTVAGIVLAAGAAYFVFQLLVVAKRRLLWRVRRKLILSYFFVGFIPVLLIVSFFLLCGLLLFFNVSSYLVQTRLRAMQDRARFMAVNAALDIQRTAGLDVAGVLSRRQAAASDEFPDASFAVVPVNRSCAAAPAVAVDAVPAVAVGSWSHVDPPQLVPLWIECSGYNGVFAYRHQAASRPDSRSDGSAVVVGETPTSAGVETDTHLFVRATAFPESAMPRFGVIVDLPLGERARRQLRDDTGVEIRGMSAIEVGEARPLPGHVGTHTEANADSTGGPLNWITFLDYRDWNNGSRGTLLVSTRPSISAIYDRISVTQGLFGNRNFNQVLVFILVLVGGLFLVIEFVALVAGLALAKSITGSVHELFAGTERVRQGDFTHKIAVHTEDQLGELAGSFNSMTASIEDLLRQAAEKKRLEEELRIAREIQMSLLPPATVGMPGLSMTALCVPAREVGGDYYDFFRLGERRLGVLIADVSGKGTSAALYMAELKGLMLSLSETHTSPHDLMLTANRIIAANLDARSFITMTYAVIDLDKRTMTYARAGHTPLIYVPGPGASTRGVKVLAPDGLVLGLNLDNGEMFERLLQEQTISLQKGDVLVLFTDGISEAMNEADDCFGEARLGRLVEEYAHLSSDDLRGHVLAEIEAFVGGAPQHDDMTMILIKIEELPAPLTVDPEDAELAGSRR